MDKSGVVGMKYLVMYAMGGRYYHVVKMKELSGKRGVELAGARCSGLLQVWK